jgi:hypothetical protein
VAVTSVKVGSLELEDPGTYAVGNETLYELAAGAPADARLVEMADRHPAYVGSTPAAREITLTVFCTAGTHTQRMSDYNALVSALSNAGGLISLTWTDGGTTYRYWCHADRITPSEWMTRVAVTLTAPNPASEVV